MKGKRDPKFSILPSTTRKGTILSSKATLDSPTVLSQLVTPPTNTRPTVDASAAESATAYDKFDDASTVHDDAGSLGSFLESLVTKSKEISMHDENLTTPVIVGNMP